MIAFLRNRTASRNLTALVGAVTLFFLVAGTGCTKEAPASPKPNGASVQKIEEEPAATPEEQLYQQVRSGMFQVSAASSSIEEALAAAKEAFRKLPAAERAAFDEVVDLIDSAGSGIAEYANDPPAKDEVVKAFGVWDEKRLKAIDAGNDAMHDLREASGALSDYEDSTVKATADAAREVRALVLVALDDLWGAVEAFGGKPETEDAPIAP